MLLEHANKPATWFYEQPLEFGWEVVSGYSYRAYQASYYVIWRQHGCATRECGGDLGLLNRDNSLKLLSRQSAT